MRVEGVHKRHLPFASSLVAVLCVATAGCGGSDQAEPAAEASAEIARTIGGSSGADEPADGEPVDGAIETEAAETGSAETGGAPGSGLGLGSATVTVGDEVHRFAISPELALDGQCRVLFGVLAIDLPLVESNGVEVEPGDGRLRMDIELEDVADYEPYAEVRAAGGHWYAGESETASISGVETPEITLTGAGMSVTGTQMMVPIVAGPGEPIEATVEATCE